MIADSPCVPAPAPPDAEGEDLLQTREEAFSHDPAIHRHHAPPTTSAGEWGSDEETSRACSDDEDSAASRHASPEAHREAGKDAGKMARVYPRKKSGEYTRPSDQPVLLTLESLSPYFHLPLKNAAEKLGLSPTAIKTASRTFGLSRWPYRRARSTPDAYRGGRTTPEAGLSGSGIGAIARSSSASAPSRGGPTSPEAGPSHAFPGAGVGAIGSVRSTPEAGPSLGQWLQRPTVSCAGGGAGLEGGQGEASTEAGPSHVSQGSEAGPSHFPEADDYYAIPNLSFLAMAMDYTST